MKKRTENSRYDFGMWNWRRRERQGRWLEMKDAKLGSWWSAKTSRWEDIKMCIMTLSKFRSLHLTLGMAQLLRWAAHCEKRLSGKRQEKGRSARRSEWNINFLSLSMLIVWNVQNIMRLRLPLVSSVSLAGKVVAGEHERIRLTIFPRDRTHGSVTRNL